MSILDYPFTPCKKDKRHNYPMAHCNVCNMCGYCCPGHRHMVDEYSDKGVQQYDGNAGGVVGRSHKAFGSVENVRPKLILEVGSNPTVSNNPSGSVQSNIMCLNPDCVNHITFVDKLYCSEYCQREARRMHGKVHHESQCKQLSVRSLALCLEALENLVEEFGDTDVDNEIGTIAITEFKNVIVEIKEVLK